MATLAHQTYLNNCLPSIKTLHSKKARKLTRRIIKSQNDWFAWQQSEYKQHQQYHDQHMFGKPQPIPSGANRLSFIWTYPRIILKLLSNYISISSRQRMTVFTIGDQHLVTIYLLVLFPFVDIKTTMKLPHVLNVIHFYFEHLLTLILLMIHLIGNLLLVSISKQLVVLSFIKRNFRIRLP